MTTDGKLLGVTNNILVVDGDRETARIVEEATSGSSVKVVPMADAALTKRRLLQERPLLVFCAVKLANDHEAGFRFCEELRAHDAYRDIPVFLFSEELSDEAIRRASTCGARGLMPKPLQASTLRVRLQPYLPKNPSTPAMQQKPERPESPPVLFVDDELSKKFHLAQTLLAKVLHNLKTSDLLKVAEEEDVPRVVFEITRSVCGIRGGTTSGTEAETTIDLDKVFGRKPE